MTQPWRRKRNVHSRYLFSLLVPAVLVGSLFSSSYLFLKNAGEYDSVRNIAARQLAAGGVYNSGVGDLTYEYKLELYEQVGPDIAVIGSSRAMQFQGAPFRLPFVNLGGAMNSLAEGRILIEDMLARHRPRIVIIVLDFWWFNGAWKEPETYPQHGLKQRGFRLGHLYKPLLWLLDGKVTLPAYARVLGGEVRNFGTQAVVWRDGYDRFGTSRYPSRIDGSRPHQHKRFAPALGWIERRNKGFVAGATVSADRLQTFENILVRLHDAGVDVITVLPPLAPTVMKAMRGADVYAYIDQLRAELKGRATWYIDAQDPEVLGTGDCEFLDGTHGGAVSYLRILREIAKAPASPLADAVDRAAIESDIANNAGHAAVRRAGEPSPKEVDFLAIGCQKPRDRQAKGG